MRRYRFCSYVLGLAAVFCGQVDAQVESHALPASMPLAVLPPQVVRMPKRTTRELSVPLLVEDKPVAEGASSGGRGGDQALKLLEGGGDPNGGGNRSDTGDPNATTLGEMSGRPRKVIRQVGQGEFKEAAAGGRALLQLKKETYNDFTWDYLANATAWACVQSGDFKRAAEAHRAAGQRLRDPAVKNYHSKAAALLSRAVARDDQDAKAAAMARRLAEPQSYRELLRKEATQDLKKARRGIRQIRQAKTSEARINNVKIAYTGMRHAWAIDPQLGRELLAEFKAAADSLASDAAAKMLIAGRKAHEEVVRWQRMPLKPSQIGFWNKRVKKLWSHVRRIKQVCRVHDYLSRLGLAGSANARVSFDGAHDLLYEPGRGRAYKLMGGKVNGALDMIRTEPARP